MTTSDVTLNSDGSLTYSENSPTGLIESTMSAAIVKSEEQIVQYWVDNNTQLTGALSPGMAAVSDLAIQDGLITAAQFNSWVADNNVQAYTYSGTPSVSDTVTASATSVANDPTVTSGGVPNQAQAQATYDLSQQQQSASATQAGPTLTANHTAAFDTVQSAYIAFYGRPADVAGLQYWENQLQSAGGNLNAIINEFGNSQESQALYGGQSVTEEVAAIYQQIFDRAPDASGQAYWVGQISSGAVSSAAAALAIFNGATGTDKTLINNKLVVADVYTDNLTSDSTASSLYAGNTAAANARSYLSAVTASTTLAAQLAGIASQVSHDIVTGISTDLASVGASAATAVQLVAVSNASTEVLHV